ncbi:MAG: acyltransferase family protein [Duncaniella sp.]|nr:acyltransferase family protein [Duncaniella sp.]
MANISSISKGPRQSNFELLKIIAMFLVLIAHADFYSLGTPGQEDFASSPVNAVTRTVFQAISIVCVNVFILISGWFRIRPSLKGFLNLIFQCAFFYGGYYIIAVVTGYATLSLGSIVYALCPDSNGISWFIVAYIALYILSPILNSFLENSSKKQIEIFLVSFYLFQTVYTIYLLTGYISHGYSPFSFIGLYVLAN